MKVLNKNKEGEIRMKYYVEGIDGATVINTTKELVKGEMVGIEINSVLSFYKVKSVGETVIPKGCPIMNKGYETVEFKGEHKIANGDERDISGLVRGQKYHNHGKLFEVLKNKNGVMDIARIEFTLVEKVLMSEDSQIEKRGGVKMQNVNNLFKQGEWAVETTGNLLDVDVEYICQQVNCQNAMGSGLALQIMTKYPIVKEKFHELSNGEKPEDLLGQAQVIKADKHLSVVNLFGQLHYGNARINKRTYTDYNALQSALETFYNSHQEAGITVAIPKYLGCGLAGGDWETVKNMVHHIANKYKVRTVIVSYSPN